jgi:hypothetical protein
VTQNPKYLLFNAMLRLSQWDLFREYARRIGKNPNICVPKRIQEKYLWRKIFDHDPQFTAFSDKLASKDYVANQAPDIPYAKVLWRGSDVREAPAELLAGPGFLKSNHGSGLYFKLGEEPVDLDTLHAMSRGWLDGQHHTKPAKWKYRGQWGYKNVERTLFIEEDLSIANDGPLVDIAIYVFGDKVTDFSVMLDHKTAHIKYARYLASGQRTDFEKATAKHSPLPHDYELPVSPEVLCDTAKRIAANPDHLRIDLMWNGRQLYFGEITVYSHAGFLRNPNQALLEEMAESWDLRRSWFLTNPQSGWRGLYANWLRQKLEAAAGR